LARTIQPSEGAENFAIVERIRVPKKAQRLPMALAAHDELRLNDRLRLALPTHE
jgi:hypothetical protein